MRVYGMLLKKNIAMFGLLDVLIYLCPRFFVHVGNETFMHLFSGNRHFFTKLHHRQIYQNYEQSRQKLATFLESKVF